MKEWDVSSGGKGDRVRHCSQHAGTFEEESILPHHFAERCCSLGSVGRDFGVLDVSKYTSNSCQSLLPSKMLSCQVSIPSGRMI